MPFSTSPGFGKRQRSLQYLLLPFVESLSICVEGNGGRTAICNGASGVLEMAMVKDAGPRDAHFGASPGLGECQRLLLCLLLPFLFVKHLCGRK